MSKVRGETNVKLEVDEAECRTTASAGLLVKILQASARWKIERIKLGADYSPMYKRYYSHMSKVRGETSANLHSDYVLCYSRLYLQVFLKIMRGFHQWSLGELDLGDYSFSPLQMMQEDWEDLAGLCSRGKIDKVVVRNKKDLEEGRSQDVEQVKRVAQKWVVL